MDGKGFINLINMHNQKFHKLCKPITLQNIKTGETKTWPSRGICATEIGASQVVVSNLAIGKQKTFNGTWINPASGLVIKPKKEKVVSHKLPIGLIEKYETIDLEKYAKKKEAYDHVAELQYQEGDTTVQSTRRYNDETAAIFLGVQEINTGNSGWDGRKDGKIPFEQKCNGLMIPHNLDGKYQDTSDYKVGELEKGALACDSAIIAPGWIAYTVVYNTKMVSGYIRNHRNNKRKEPIVPLNHILAAGGKIVAKMYSVKDTYADVIRHYPRLKRYLSEKDIHPASESKKIANEMAYWQPEPDLW